MTVTQFFELIDSQGSDFLNAPTDIHTVRLPFEVETHDSRIKYDSSFPHDVEELKRTLAHKIAEWLVDKIEFVEYKDQTRPTIGILRGQIAIYSNHDSEKAKLSKQVAELEVQTENLRNQVKMFDSVVQNICNMSFWQRIRYAIFPQKMINSQKKYLKELNNGYTDV